MGTDGVLSDARVYPTYRAPRQVGGWAMVLLLLGGATAYAGGGVLWAARVAGNSSGGGTALRELQSHPHWAEWCEMRSLVTDGYAFCRGRLGGSGYSNLQGRAESAEARADEAEADAKRAKRSLKKAKRQLEGGKPARGSPSSPSKASDRGEEGRGGDGRRKDTASGDGERWVKVDAKTAAKLADG